MPQQNSMHTYTHILWKAIAMPSSSTLPSSSSAYQWTFDACFVCNFRSRFSSLRFAFVFVPDDEQRQKFSDLCVYDWVDAKRIHNSCLKWQIINIFRLNVLFHWQCSFYFGRAHFFPSTIFITLNWLSFALFSCFFCVCFGTRTALAFISLTEFLIEFNVLFFILFSRSVENYHSSQ